jgi:hypothetical protein
VEVETDGRPMGHEGGLTIELLNKCFGGLTAVDNLSFSALEVQEAYLGGDEI